MDFLQILDITGKLVLAAALGGAIGWQRESLDRPAGLRTHILVCVGSAIYMLVSTSFDVIGSDPGRIAAQVATGMGFLGAGTIIRHGSVVRGLTTAASLWVMAAVGLCVGRGGASLTVAVIGTLVVLATLTLLKRIEVTAIAHRQYRSLLLRACDGTDQLPALQQALGALGVEIASLEVVTPLAQGAQELRVVLRIPAAVPSDDVTNALARLPGLSALHWE
jgi:putative Mg2+ transporter-C (MgtC) family protein